MLQWLAVFLPSTENYTNVSAQTVVYWLMKLPLKLKGHRQRHTTKWNSKLMIIFWIKLNKNSQFIAHLVNLDLI